MKMKKTKPIFNLTPEEKDMHEALVRGGYNSIPVTEEQKKELIAIAQNTIAKNKMITIRLSDRDLMRLKAKAMQEGLPYQTLVASLIHKYI